MTIWSDFLAEIRTDLKDTGATPRWSDALVFVYTKDGIRDYSQWFPRRIDRVAISATNGAYALPTDFIEEIHVECPINTYLEKRVERPGVRQNSYRYGYYIQGGSLYHSPLETIYLTYLACHPVPTSEDDDVFTFTIPDVDMELIRLYVKALCYGQLRSRQASLDRFKTSGQRDDNPVILETENLMDTYHAKIAERIRGGMISLYRPGRMK